MKKLVGFTIILLTIVLNSCYTETASADSELASQTELQMKEANRQVGMPAIQNFQEKKIMKWIYELRDQENLICYAYLFNEIEGKVGQYLGQCIGYGLPYSAQFSNPEKIITWETVGASVKSSIYPGTDPQTISQPEPNGLFMPEGLSATWLLLVDPVTNEPRPVYIEPAIIVSPFKLH